MDGALCSVQMIFSGVCRAAVSFCSSSSRLPPQHWAISRAAQTTNRYKKRQRRIFPALDGCIIVGHLQKNTTTCIQIHAVATNLCVICYVNVNANIKVSRLGIKRS